MKVSKHDRDWLPLVLQSLRHQGFAIVEDVLDDEFLRGAKAALFRAQELLQVEIDKSRLERAGELGVIRLPMKFDRTFFHFLSNPDLLQVVDATVGDTAILHLQNGFVLPTTTATKSEGRVFQQRFHQDFPRHMAGYLASINCFFAIDEFTENNGATFVVPGTHQRSERPSEEYMAKNAVAATCRAGSMLVFDSTLWHAAGINNSGRDRCAINHQFTRSFLKQQIDYVRALGAPLIQELPSRTQQLLGWYTRVVTSLDEYYRPQDERLYRAGQG